MDAQEREVAAVEDGRTLVIRRFDTGTTKEALLHLGFYLILYGLNDELHKRSRNVRNATPLSLRRRLRKVSS